MPLPHQWPPDCHTQIKELPPKRRLFYSFFVLSPSRSLEYDIGSGDEFDNILGFTLWAGRVDAFCHVGRSWHINDEARLAVFTTVLVVHLAIIPF